MVVAVVQESDTLKKWVVEEKVGMLHLPALLLQLW